VDHVFVPAPASAAASAPAASLDVRALDRSLVRGVAWTAAAKWIAQGLTVLSWLIVARLLSPEDYGLVGMAALHLGLITLVSEFGLGTAVLAERALGREQLTQLNGVAVLLGLAGLLVSAALAIPLGRFFRAPQLPLVIVAMSTTFLITSFKTVPLALLQRDLRFKMLALIDVTQAFVVTAGMVAFAALGFRYWTLVAGGLLGALVSTGGVLRLRALPLAWPRRASIRRALRVSADVVLARVCWYASTNADFLVAGRLLGTAALGLYSLAWVLASIAVDRIAALIGQVTPAVLSAVQNDAAAMRRYVLRITEGLALLTFPISIGLALVARDLVPVVLGPRWSGTVLPLQLLSLYAALRSITPLLPQVLQLTGDSRFEMWRMAAAVLLMPVGFYVSAKRWGTVGLATAWIVLDPILLLALYHRVFTRIGMSARQYFAALWPAVSATLLMAAAVLTVAELLGRDSTRGARLAGQIAAGVATYGLACALLHRARFVAVRDLLTAARRKLPEVP
jgi:PST family polysaccharide transporter